MLERQQQPQPVACHRDSTAPMSSFSLCRRRPHTHTWFPREFTLRIAAYGSTRLPTPEPERRQFMQSCRLPLAGIIRRAPLAKPRLAALREGAPWLHQSIMAEWPHEYHKYCSMYPTNHAGPAVLPESPWAAAGAGAKWASGLPLPAPASPRAARSGRARSASAMADDGEQYQYDLFCIGAGSGGVRASRMSASYGGRVAVCEMPYAAKASDDLGGAGGTCVIRGCVPKKLLVFGSHFRRAPRRPPRRPASSAARRLRLSLPPPVLAAARASHTRAPPPHTLAATSSRTQKASAGTCLARRATTGRR